ncbi:MAG TPA: hypothetical protein VK742_20570 [Candidatus Sulfotelmatobacter sp.]|jgi:hypothetical protein|nr:hypothetical protein [Candidatus Sulfotelmatobacter sp.]
MNQTFGPASFGNAPGVPIVPMLLTGLLLFCIGWLVVGTFYTRYTGLSRWRSAISWFFSLLIAITAMVIVLPRGQWENQEIFLIFLSMLSVPFAIRLYRKLIGGWLTDAEKLPGMDGVRAWLTPGNLVCAVLIPICTWQVFFIALPAMFALTFGLVLVYPVFNLVSASPQPAPAGPSEDLSTEREKVLRLLETGKITADESAELLNALGSTVPHRPPPAAEINMSPARKMVLLGAVLLLVGFFLPWFSINPSQLLSEAAAQMRQMTAGMTPRIDLSSTLTPDPNSMSLQVHAGDVAHGLGWWILALGISAAVLPFFATTLKADMQKKVILAALAVGAFLLVYLLHDTLRYVSTGAILALAGYTLEFVGTFKERPAAH